MSSHNKRTPDSFLFHLPKDGQEKPENMEEYRLWTCLPDMEAEEVEQTVYEALFVESLRSRNEMYRNNFHPERIQSMDVYRKNPRNCPEETIVDICPKESESTNGTDVVWELFLAQLKWEETTFPNVKILDAALVRAKNGAVRLYERKVWIGHDKDKNPVAGQAKALSEMGIAPPDPERLPDRRNNPKVTYSSMWWKHLKELFDQGQARKESPCRKELNG
jgi:hypothetical protein